MSQYFLRLRNQVTGPFSLEQLRIMRQLGSFSRIHEISEDCDTWKPATTLVELFQEKTTPAEASAETDPTATASTTPVPEAFAPLEPDTPSPANVSFRRGAHWFYAKDGKQTGPVELWKLQRLLTQRHVSPDDLVWQEGMPTWVPAREVAGLIPPAPPPTNRADESAGTDESAQHGGSSSSGAPDGPEQQGARSVSRFGGTIVHRSAWLRDRRWLLLLVVLFVGLFPAGICWEKWRSSPNPEDSDESATKNTTAGEGLKQAPHVDSTPDGAGRESTTEKKNNQQSRETAAEPLASRVTAPAPVEHRKPSVRSVSEYFSLPIPKYDLARPPTSESLNLDSVPESISLSLLGGDDFERDKEVGKLSLKWSDRSGEIQSTARPGVVAWIEYEDKELKFKLSNDEAHKPAHQALRDCVLEIDGGPEKVRHVALRDQVNHRPLQLKSESEVTRSRPLWAGVASSSRRLFLKNCQLLDHDGQSLMSAESAPNSSQVRIPIWPDTLLDDHPKPLCIVSLTETTQENRDSATVSVRVEFEPRLSKLNNILSRMKLEAGKETNRELMERRLRTAEAKKDGPEVKRIQQLLAKRANYEKADKAVKDFEKFIKEIEIVVDVCYKVTGIEEDVVVARLRHEQE